MNYIAGENNFFMDNITIIRGDDGFGSQLTSIISGIAYCRYHNKKYLHTPINNFKLLNKNTSQNYELNRCNELINKIVLNLGLEMKKNSDSCIIKPFFHNEIQQDVDNYFSESFLKELQDSFPEKIKPDYYNKFNIAIHIRRGEDIFESDKPVRWIESNIYEEIIKKLRIKYPNALFNIFSWGDSGIEKSDDIEFHTSSSGEKFFEDFVSLVLSDLLVIGSSSFSVAAAMFHSGIVLCDKNIFKISNPVPSIWFENYRKIMECNL